MESEFMKCTLLIILLLVTGCIESDLDLEEVTCNSALSTYFSPDNRTFIPPAEGEFILSLCDRPVPENIGGYFDLDFSKICIVQENLRKVLQIASDKYCQPEYSSFDLTFYHYQFLGVLIDQRENVYINAFHLPMEDTIGTFTNWETHPIDTCGGANLYWGAMLELETGEFTQFDFNTTGDRVILAPGPETVIDNGCGRCTPFSVEEYFMLKNEEVCILESNFYKLEELISHGCYYSGYSIAFDGYYPFAYQYLGVNIDMRKYIYVNALSIFYKTIYNDYPGWTKEYAHGCDGSLNFWGVLFDLENLTFSNLEFNCR